MILFYVIEIIGVVRKYLVFHSLGKYFGCVDGKGQNLEESIDSKALHHTFSALGVVLSCKVQLDRDGKSLGYGFVQFQDEEDAQRAISLANGRLLEGKQVYVGPFIPRSTDRMQAGMNLNPLDLNPAYKTAPAPSRTNMTSAHLREGRSAVSLSVDYLILTS